MWKNHFDLLQIVAFWIHDIAKLETANIAPHQSRYTTTYDFKDKGAYVYDLHTRQKVEGLFFKSTYLKLYITAL